MRFLAVLMAFMLIGCITPKDIRKKQRAQQKMHKLALKYGLTDTFTLEVKDTIYTSSVSVDTLFNTDTLRIDTGRLHLKIVRINNTDSIYVSALCDADTIYYTKTVHVDRPYINPVEVWLWKVYKRFKVLFWLFIIGLAVGLIVRYGRKFI